MNKTLKTVSILVVIAIILVAVGYFVLHKPNNWKTYANEQYGFEFQYPQTFNNFVEDIETSNSDPVTDYIGTAESKNGYVGAWVKRGAILDPGHIENALGNIMPTTKIKIGNQDGYMFYGTDEGCGGHTVRTQLQNGVLQINLVSCITDAEPFLAEDKPSLTPLEKQILATFKFANEDQ